MVCYPPSFQVIFMDCLGAIMLGCRQSQKVPGGCSRTSQELLRGGRVRPKLKPGSRTICFNHFAQLHSGQMVARWTCLYNKCYRVMSSKNVPRPEQSETVNRVVDGSLFVIHTTEGVPLNWSDRRFALTFLDATPEAIRKSFLRQCTKCYILCK